MKLIEISVKTLSAGTDAVCNAIYDLGITGVSIEDKADVRKFLEENKDFWDYVDDELLQDDGFVYVKTYINCDDAGKATVEQLKEKMNELKAADTDGMMGELSVQTGLLDDQDWANSWKQYFKPFEVGDSFVVKPSWEEYNAAEGKHIIDIDPGMAFGTGQHHTTKLCIEHIENAISGGENVLDMGCGSGILAIAALLEGAKHVDCIDVDSIAVSTAEENIHHNGFGDSAFRCFHGNVLSDETFAAGFGEECYDVITANIVADVIIAMAPLFKRYIKADGKLICSGIIDERAAEVAEALEKQGFVLENARHSGGWTALLYERRL